jgi:hypothetical protein
MIFLLFFLFIVTTQVLFSSIDTRVLIQTTHISNLPFELLDKVFYHTMDSHDLSFNYLKKNSPLQSFATLLTTNKLWNTRCNQQCTIRNFSNQWLFDLLKDWDNHIILFENWKQTIFFNELSKTTNLYLDQNKAVLQLMNPFISYISSKNNLSAGLICQIIGLPHYSDIHLTFLASIPLLARSDKYVGPIYPFHNRESFGWFFNSVNYNYSHALHTKNDFYHFIDAINNLSSNTMFYLSLNKNFLEKYCQLYTQEQEKCILRPLPLFFILCKNNNALNQFLIKKAHFGDLRPPLYVLKALACKNSTKEVLINLIIENFYSREEKQKVLKYGQIIDTIFNNIDRQCYNFNLYQRKLLDTFAQFKFPLTYKDKIVDKSIDKEFLECMQWKFFSIPKIDLFFLEKMKIESTVLTINRMIACIRYLSLTDEEIKTLGLKHYIDQYEKYSNNFNYSQTEKIKCSPPFFLDIMRIKETIDTFFPSLTFTIFALKRFFKYHSFHDVNRLISLQYPAEERAQNQMIENYINEIFKPLKSIHDIFSPEQERILDQCITLFFNENLKTPYYKIENPWIDCLYWKFIQWDQAYQRHDTPTSKRIKLEKCINYIATKTKTLVHTIIEKLSLVEYEKYLQTAYLASLPRRETNLSFFNLI